MRHTKIKTTFTPISDLITGATEYNSKCSHLKKRLDPKIKCTKTKQLSPKIIYEFCLTENGNLNYKMRKLKKFL